MKMLSRNNVVVLVHIFCWLILAIGVLYYIPSTWGVPVPTEFWIKQTILLVILMGVFYLNFNLLIPNLLIKQKVFIYIALVIALVVLVTVMNNFTNYTFKLNQFIPNKPHPAALENPHHRRHFDTFVPGMNLLMIGLGITVSFIQKWQQEVNLRQQLEKEKITTELTLLKAQINPHFFFNTLNTIYSYTLSDGDVARTAITNLSKMMRYVLYDAADRHTPLSKEIAFIKEYTELMKLRISRKTEVLLQVQDRSDEVMIAPMIFLPFVENAFKHGVSSISAGHISIQIIQNKESIELIVTNNIYENRRPSEEESNGIGIANTMRRLELLYPGNYTLKTGTINETEYQAKLMLFL